MPAHPASPSPADPPDFRWDQAADRLDEPCRQLARWLQLYSPRLDRLHEEAVQHALRLLAQTGRALRERARATPEDGAQRSIFTRMPS